jgi:hypothetical protein
MNNINIIILGAYTLIYIIVFFIQRSQIQKTKEINNSMKAFMDIFKIEEVRRFVDLKTERIMMEAESLVANDEKVTSAINDIVKEKVGEIQKVYGEQMGQQHLEMTAVIVGLLKKIRKEDREQLINEQLSSCKHIFLPMLNDIENNKI